MAQFFLKKQMRLLHAFVRACALTPMTSEYQQFRGFPLSSITMESFNRSMLMEILVKSGFTLIRLNNTLSSRCL